MAKFKVGDKIRRIKDGAFGIAPIGYETTVIDGNWVGDDRVWYTDMTGDKVHGDEYNFELIQPFGPIVTENVTTTKRRLVLGYFKYGKLVGERDARIQIADIENSNIDIGFSGGRHEAKDLRALAKMLNEIAEVLDEQAS